MGWRSGIISTAGVCTVYRIVKYPNKEHLDVMIYTTVPYRPYVIEHDVSHAYRAMLRILYIHIY